MMRSAKRHVALLGVLAMVLWPNAVRGARANENDASSLVQRWATDVHVSIGGVNLTVPFVALDELAYQQPASIFSQRTPIGPVGPVTELLKSTPASAVTLGRLSLVMRTYGWSDSDPGRIEICGLFTRTWAQTVCDNPWAALQQALPPNRFALVDLKTLVVRPDANRIFGCRDNVVPSDRVPRDVGHVALVCQVAAFSDQPLFRTVSRVSGDLGVLWTVSTDSQSRESAEAIAAREAKAISAFVKYGLNEHEDPSALNQAVCALRRPGLIDHLGKTGC